MPAKSGKVKLVRKGFRPKAPHARISLPNDFEPREYQKPAMRHILKGGKRAVVVWPRRHGKDLAFLHVHACMSQKRVGAYWHCLPTYAQAKKSVWNAFRKDGKPIISNAFPDGMLAKKPNDSEMMLTFKNGSTFQLIGSDNIDTLVGAGPVGITFSEFAVSRPGSWDLVRPMLRENEGWAGFMSTPRGRNHFFKLYETAKRESWFHQLETIETAKALPLSIIDEERREGMPEELIRQEYYCDFNAALVGSVYGDILEKLEASPDRVCDFDHSLGDVYTSWDLGIGDSTAIWFWRLNGDGVELIDHLENHSKPLSFYMDEVDAKPYSYIRHYLPHDAKARTLVTGSSVLDYMLERYTAKHVAVVPSLSLPDGLQAARAILQRKGTRFHRRCDKGLEALREYHYEWLEDEHVMSKKPVHDWTSHTADAFRYMGIIVKLTLLLDAKEAIKPPLEIPSMNNQFRLEELWETRAKEMSRF